jgi:hypothetical protein
MPSGARTVSTETVVETDDEGMPTIMLVDEDDGVRPGRDEY